MTTCIGTDSKLEICIDVMNEKTSKNKADDGKFSFMMCRIQLYVLPVLEEMRLLNNKTIFKLPIASCMLKNNQFFNIHEY